MSTYTIESVHATGKSDETYGDEYLVHFKEDLREVKLSRKAEPQIGGEENGQIIDGKYGAYFKKDPYQPNAQGTPTNVPEKKWAPMRKDNSDGMRQGMCFNNAAAYVAAQGSLSPLVAPEKWADTVYAYANALYLKGDLGAEPVIQADADTTSTAKDVFGVS